MRIDLSTIPGTAACAAFMLANGEIAALSFGFGLYGVRHAEREERRRTAVGAICGLFAVLFAFGMVFFDSLNNLLLKLVAAILRAIVA